MPVAMTAALSDVPRTIVLVGLMGAGKTCIGKRLANKLHLDFVDADAEIEKAAGMTISEIFEVHGEEAFRDGERRVIARLLNSPPHVLATGGGAFVNPQTRALIKERAISVWLRAELSLLVRRTSRRSHRPLLRRGNPREILKGLIDERHPIYTQADVTVDSVDGPPDVTVNKVLSAVADYVARHDIQPSREAETAKRPDRCETRK